MLLLDDNFVTIFGAIEEKCIFHNIRCFVCFQPSTYVTSQPCQSSQFETFSGYRTT